MTLVRIIEGLFGGLAVQIDMHRAVGCGCPVDTSVRAYFSEDIEEAPNQIPALDGAHSCSAGRSFRGAFAHHHTRWQGSTRDVQGELNQRLAVCAQRVVLMVAGMPLTVKDERCP